MRTRLAIFFVLWLALVAALVVHAAPPAVLPPIQRNFFTTNPAPVVDAVAGSNVTVQATTVGTDTRHFTVNAMTDTNVVNILLSGVGGIVVAGGTNIVAVTNGSVVTINASTDTNIINLVFGTAWTNNDLAIGLGATNQSLLIGANGTNDVLRIGLAATNNDLAMGLSATNQSLLIGANATNDVLRIGVAATNNDLVIGAGATNQSLLIGANATNDVLRIGLAATNNDLAMGLLSTNQSLLIGQNATNNDLLFGVNATNQSLLIGANGTNNVIAATNSLADTNWVLSQLASYGSYLYFGGPTNSFAITNSGESVSRTNVWTGSTAPFATASTSSVASLTLNAYVRHVISTNTFSVIESGPVSISTYPFKSGGGTPQIHYEFYAVDTVSNIMYELAAGPATQITATVPTLIQTSLTLTNSFIATNRCYFCIAAKIDNVGAGNTLYWAHGGGYDAHATFVRPLSSATINASQIVGVLPAGTVCGTTNTADGWVIGNTNQVRMWTQNGGAFTNLNLTLATNEVTRALASASWSETQAPMNNGGTNFILSPTNGNLQKLTLTNQTWIAMASSNTNNTETLRLNITGTNTIVWDTSVLSNSTSLSATSGITCLLFDHAGGTNLWWGYRLR